MVYIDWNFTNWITILIMAGLGFAILGFVTSIYKNNKQQAA